MNAAVRLVIRLSYYPSRWFNRGMCVVGIWNRWDWIDESVLFGQVPARRDLPRLQSLGIRAIVNMCAESASDPETLKQCEIEEFRLPTVDFHSPSAADLKRGVEYLREQVSRGRKVYVHCKAGRGRGPLMVLCYLIASRGLTATEAFAIIKQARPHVNSRLDRRPVAQAVEKMMREGAFADSPPTAASSDVAR